MKILVIFTGGTIGSRIKDGWISPDKNTKYELIEEYRKNNQDNIDFSFLEPYFVLSENLCENELNLLSDCVLNNIQKDYDGIIITHGTDTLQYSAAAIAYAVGSDSIPILFVSSNYPLSDTRSNGSANFKGAVEFIRQKCGRGVYISYKNRFENLKFHSALSAMSFPETDDLVQSLYGKHYAEYIDGHITICHDTEKIQGLGKTIFCKNPSILVIGANPGDSFNYDTKKYKAVILRPYHSGTLNTSSPHFTDFCLRAKADSLPIFVPNIHPETAYESSRIYESLGIIPIHSSAFISVFMRIWIAISRGENLNKLF